MRIFYTSVTPDPDTQLTSWLRNTLIVEYPDNILLLHLKETITDLDNCESLHGFMEGRYGWTLIQPEGELDGVTLPKVGVFMDTQDDLDETRHILHISIGSFMIHLVEEKSVVEFDRFTECFCDEGQDLPIFAGHIQVQKNEYAEPPTSPPEWRRKRKIYLMGVPGGRTKMGKY